MTDLEEAQRFHGHFCPGLLIGYRAAKIALRELGAQRAEYGELIAICENDVCGVDAVQVLTGCTTGKGNLIVHDWGKQVFAFGRRGEPRMLRVAKRHGVMDGDAAQSPEEHRRATQALLQSAPDAELYDIRWIDATPPTRHRTLTASSAAAAARMWQKIAPNWWTAGPYAPSAWQTCAR